MGRLFAVPIFMTLLGGINLSMQILLPFSDSYQIKDHFDPKNDITLHCGDAKNFLKTIPDEFVTLIITSPPYNVGKEYETKTEIEIYLQTQSEVISELIRVLKPNGSICWEVGNYVSNSEVFPLDIFYYNIFKKEGLKQRL